jgi:hypothetical protein
MFFIIEEQRWIIGIGLMSVALKMQDLSDFVHGD